MPCARTVSTPSSSRVIRSASVSSSPMGRPPVSSVLRRYDRCSEPTMSFQGRGRSPLVRRASTWTETSRADAAGPASTAGDKGPIVSIAEMAATA